MWPAVALFICTWIKTIDLWLAKFYKLMQRILKNVSTCRHDIVNNLADQFAPGDPESGERVARVL